MGPVETQLLFSPSHGFLKGGLYATRLLVRVEDHLARRVPRGPADHLDKGPPGAQEPLPVSVEDPHEGDLGEVESLPEEINAHQD